MSRDIDEAGEREALKRAAALDALGPRAGAGATIWARATSDLLERHETIRDGLGELIGPEDWERFISTALLTVVAIDQVLTFEQRVRKLTGDAELAKASGRFDAIEPHAKAIRDLVVHMDEYAIGEGQRQAGKGKGQPPIRERNLRPLVYWGVADDGSRRGTVITLANEQIDLRRAAIAAVELAAVTERVRSKHLRRASDEARAAAES